VRTTRTRFPLASSRRVRGALSWAPPPACATMRGVPTSLRALACAVTLAAPLAAQAVASCSSLSASGIAFGAYDPFSTAPLDAAGTLTWRCPGVGAIQVTLSSGASPTFTSRTMVGGMDQLAYNVYLDAARITVFGDGSGGTSVIVLSGGGPQQKTSVYGRVFPQQDVSAGTYADTLMVTFNF
jgi:spore coat protein U-like protein